jgi:hypothetical protein
LTSVGIRAIADGLPNLASVSLSGFGDESFQYLLSRKPFLSAFDLVGLPGAFPRTAAQISRMGHLQYLRVSCHGLDGTTMRAMFENAHFGQLKTLRLDEIEEFDSLTLKVMAVACPNLEQLSLSVGYTPPNWITDDIVEFIFDSCRGLRVFDLSASVKSLTGEGWLDNVGTLLPRIQCLAVSSAVASDRHSSEFLRRADVARSQNPKLSILVDDSSWSIDPSTDHRYNEEVTVFAIDVWKVFDSMPRLCDLEAGRVRHPNVLLEAVRFKLAENKVRF